MSDRSRPRKQPKPLSSSLSPSPPTPKTLTQSHMARRSLLKPFLAFALSLLALYSLLHASPSLRPLSSSSSFSATVTAAITAAAPRPTSAFAHLTCPFPAATCSVVLPSSSLASTPLYHPQELLVLPRRCRRCTAVHPLGVVAATAVHRRPPLGVVAATASPSSLGFSLRGLEEGGGGRWRPESRRRGRREGSAERRRAAELAGERRGRREGWRRRRWRTAAASPRVAAWRRREGPT